MRVYKYPLDLSAASNRGVIPLQMPENAHILSIQTQNGTPTIWAAVEPGRGVITRKILVVGTGHDCPFDDSAPPPFLGTCQVGSFVWHFFEVS